MQKRDLRATREAQRLVQAPLAWSIFRGRRSIGRKGSQNSLEFLWRNWEEMELWIDKLYFHQCQRQYLSRFHTLLLIKRYNLGAVKSWQFPQPVTGALCLWSKQRLADPTNQPPSDSNRRAPVVTPQHRPPSLTSRLVSGCLFCSLLLSLRTHLRLQLLVYNALLSN